MTTPSHGVLQFQGAGFSYQPFSGYSGVDAFTYRLRTPAGSSAPATARITIAPPGAPVPVSDFRVVARTGNTLTFGWTPPTTGATLTGFSLEGGAVPGAVLGVVPLGLTPRATVTLPSGSFYVRLRSVAGGAASTPSGEVFVQVGQAVPPAPPVNLLGGVTGNRVELAWIRGLTRGDTSNVVLDVTGSATGSLPIGDVDTFVLDGVPDGTYTIAARQVGPGGSSAPSPPVTIAVPATCGQSGAPSTPRRVQAFATGRRVSVEWEPPFDGAAPTGYELRLFSPISTSVLISGRAIGSTVAPGTYTLAVMATTRCRTGGLSTNQTVVVP